MKREIVGFVILSLFCSTVTSFVAIAEPTVEMATESFEVSISPENTLFDGDPQIEINYPEASYLYLFKLKPIKMPLSSILGLKHAVVVNRNLKIDTEASGIHHAEFIAKRIFTGWETAHRWDYRSIDGLSIDLDLTTGIYDITTYAYDEGDNKLGSDSIRVLFIKIGRDDFGIRINTKYDGGETFSTPLDIGLAEFGSMLSTGETKKFNVTMQKEDDTSVELRFTKTKIMDNSEKVIETKFNIETLCDTTKDHEVSLEVRFPFALLNEGQLFGSNNPYFSAKVGYESYSSTGGAPNKVDTIFYFGRESIEDPRVFRLKLKPDSLEPDSKLTFFTSYLAVDGSGNEVFQRIFSVGFEPATELTITAIPREAKISYDFGDSAGVPTKISFRAEGGLLDGIIQSFAIDPLPSYMSFDLTIIGKREFLYESDSTYDIAYSLDSEQNGNLVTFEVDEVPTRICATWGLDLGTFGDLSASGFADLDMSEDVERIALFFYGNEIPFIEIENFPKKLRLESFVDIPNGKGNISVSRDMDEARTINAAVTFDDLMLTGELELKNKNTTLSWDIGDLDGKGNITVERDSDSVSNMSASLIYNDWTITGALQLKNEFLQLSWDTDREDRKGNIALSRSESGGSPTISASIAHEGWVLSDSLELKNDYIEFYWDLPSPGSNHAELGLYTSGDEMFYNTLSVVDDSVEILSIGIGIQTEDHFYLSWDYEGGQISNFDWSGRILRLSDVDISVNLAGDVFSIDADLSVGEEGALELSLNKEAAVTFVDSESDHFKVLGSTSFFADSRLNVSWELGESGEFTIYTFSEPVGDEFSLEFIWDPFHTGNYRYGFRLIGEDFIEITRTIKWYSEGGQLVRIWILGDLQLPGDWELQILWDYEWYTVPWP